MAQDAGTWGGEESTTVPGEGEGITPGQLRAERLARAHALAGVAEEAAATAGQADACRGDGTWSGPAHDAFAAALDELVERITRAAGGLRAAADA